MAKKRFLKKIWWGNRGPCVWMELVLELKEGSSNEGRGFLM